MRTSALILCIILSISSIQLFVNNEGKVMSALLPDPRLYLNGTVTDPMAMPIEGIEVRLTSGGIFFNNTTTEENGSFSFLVSEGNYSITINETDRFEGFSGGPYTMIEDPVSVSITLSNRTNVPGWFNITFFYPFGDDVYLYEDIAVSFSQPVDPNSIESMITVNPALTEPAFSLVEADTTVLIGHDLFEPNTTYHVTVSQDLLSDAGYLLWNGSFVWNFTTGSVESPWAVTYKNVVVGGDREVDIMAIGELSMEVFFVIPNIGSFPLTEGPKGTYTTSIDGEAFLWDTYYDYYFSDSDGGPNKAIGFEGAFKTPVAPIVWKLDSAKVKVDGVGDWIVRAEGAANLMVWIVIPGVGSFELYEDTSDPGLYETAIPSFMFEDGEEYDYWFSDASSGSDKAPLLSGSLRTKEEKAFGLMESVLVCCLAAAISLFLLIIIIAFLATIRKRGGHKRLEE